MATYQSVDPNAKIDVRPHLDRARDSLRAAETLRDAGLLCDGVTRAHQATVHTERGLLATEKRNPQQIHDVHRLATNHFLQNETLDPAYIGRLNDLGLMRQRADDQPLMAAETGELDGAIELARGFIADAEAYLSRAGFLGDADPQD